MSRASYDWKQLPDGPRLAVATVPHAECAALTIHVPAGSRDEADSPNGLAHFVEHMVFKGTPTRDARKLSMEIENVGGQINACTSEDQTTYEGRGEADLLPQMAEILGDMVWSATFPARELELERDVIREEITMYRESPTDHIGDLTSQALWGSHPLGRPITGTPESITRVSRADLVLFRDRHHFRRDLVIAAAGPFTLDDVHEVLQAHLPATFHDPIAYPSFDASRALPKHLVEKRDTDQLQLALAWHTPGRHSQHRHALRLLSLILGETASSRLFLDLREERGLCYQISSDTSFFDETGTFEIHAGLHPDGRDEAIACIHRELQDIAGRGPTDDELARAKRLAIAQSKLAFESTSAHAAWAGEGVLDFGFIPCRDHWRDQVLAVTADDIRSVTGDHLAAPPNIAEIRPDS